MANKKITPANISKPDFLVAEFKRLEARNGSLTAYSVLEEARSATSVLHAYFDWEDSSAAEKFRLNQARTLINSVQVQFLGRTTDAYFNVRYNIENVPQRGYFSAETVLTNEELRQQVLNSAINEIEYWQTKYKDLTELIGLVDQEGLVKLKNKK